MLIFARRCVLLVLRVGGHESSVVSSSRGHTLVTRPTKDDRRGANPFTPVVDTTNTASIAATLPTVMILRLVSIILAVFNKIRTSQIYRKKSD